MDFVVVVIKHRNTIRKTADRHVMITRWALYVWIHVCTKAIATQAGLPQTLPLPLPHMANTIVSSCT